MVVVFGSINLDLVARVPRFPAPGETLTGTAFATAPGGKGANQALAARRAGAAVAIFGAVGRDAFAGDALVNLRAAGVDLAGVQTVDAPTGIALIHVDDRGENAITVIPGANALASVDRVPATALRPDVTFLMQLEVPLSETIALAARAKAAGARVILNAAPAAPLPEAFLRDLDVLVVNKHEAAALAAAWRMAPAPDEFVARARERFGVTVVITLGVAGAVSWHAGHLLRHPAPVVNVVDTTGAGDAFVGALAATLDRGESLAAALANGVGAGAAACGHSGAQLSKATP